MDGPLRRSYASYASHTAYVEYRAVAEDRASSLVSLRHEGRRSALPVLLSLRAPTELALDNDVRALRSRAVGTHW